MMKYWLCLVIVLLAGCSSVPSNPKVIPHAVSMEGHGWWYVSFRFDWPEGESPAWHRDVMVAHRVIAPVLAGHRNKITLWRVHRRAVRDAAGHQLSFIFYASPETAYRVYEDIKANPDLSFWRQEGLIQQVQFDDPSHITRPGIQDTSDPAWPLIIQKTWPAYIMGISEMWLDLVTRLGTEYASNSHDEKPYRKISLILNRLWADNARHALFHHLNAVYAYQPFLTRY